MRFVVEKDVFASALAFVEKYAATGKQIPVLGDVKIVASDGRVSLTATDADQSASDHVPADIGEDGDILLPARTLLNAVRSGGGSDLTITADDKQATIACGRSRFKLPIRPGSDFPSLPMLDSDAATKFTITQLDQIASRVLFAAEPDKGRYFIAGVSWKYVGDKIELAAMDGKKFSMMSINAPPEALDMPAVIVPRFAVPGWAGDVDVAISSSFVRYSHGSQVVASKLVEASYPEYSRLIPKNETSLLFDRVDLSAAINRMSVIANGGDHSILFVGRNGKVIISASSGDSEVSDEINFDGDDFQIAIIHDVIAPILESFDSEIIEWRYRDHVTGVAIHDPKDGGRLAFAMPYRDKRMAEYLEFREAAE